LAEIWDVTSFHWESVFRWWRRYQPSAGR